MEGYKAPGWSLSAGESVDWRGRKFNGLNEDGICRRHTKISGGLVCWVSFGTATGEAFEREKLER